MTPCHEYRTTLLCRFCSAWVAMTGIATNGGTLNRDLISWNAPNRCVEAVAEHRSAKSSGEAEYDAQS